MEKLLHSNLSQSVEKFGKYYLSLDDKVLLRSWPEEELYGMYNYKTDHLCETDKVDFEIVEEINGNKTIEELVMVDGQPDYRRIELFQELIEEEIVIFGDRPIQINPLQKNNSVEIPFLRNVCWIISSICNLSCEHCYIMEQDCVSNQFTFDQIVYTIEKLVNSNVLSVFLTGGEFFARPDAVDILEELDNNLLCIKGINTNGILINEKIIAQLMRLNIRPHLNISIDGIEFHDRFRNHEGAFDKTLNVIKSLVDEGFTVNINTSVTRPALDELKNLYGILQKLGIRAWRLNVPYLMGKWVEKHIGHQLTVPEEIGLYKEIFLMWDHDSRPFALSLGNIFRTNMCSTDEGDNEEPEINSIKGYVCEYYRNDCVIFPDGTVVGCNGLCELPDWSAGNILDASLTELWTSPQMRRFKDITVQQLLENCDANSQCSECDLISECGLGCRITAYTETGSILNKDPRMCEALKTSYRWFARRGEVS